MLEKPFGKLMLWLASLAWLLASCASPAPAPLPTPSASPTPPSGRGQGGTLHILFWDAPTILNPHLSLNRKDHQLSRIVYEPLASYDKDGQLTPFLAAEIPTPAADGRSVTWKLKKGIYWSDGQPFTADDVRFTFDFITNPAVSASSAVAYSTVETVTVVDPYTVDVKFKEMNPAWSVPFVGIYGVILPRHMFEAYNGANAKDAPANLDPVGTGPYRPIAPGLKPQEVLLLGSELVQTNKVIFEPNPYYRDKDKPYFSQIDFRGGGTASEAARLSLQTGDVNFAWNLSLPADELNTLASAGQAGSVQANFGSTVEQIELNRTDPNKSTADGERSSLQFPHPFWSDLKVRQALAYAVDRDAIAALYGAAGKPTDHILVSPPQYNPNQTVYGYDLKKAAALLDEAGWKDTDGDGIRDKDGVKLHILFQTIVGPVRQETQRIIRTALESIGVEVELKIIDASVFYGSDFTNPSNTMLFTADLQEYDWTSISPDPGLFVGYWRCNQIAQKANNWGGWNSSRWCSPEYDALFAQAQQELDPAKRRDIFIKMNNMLTEDVVMVPLVWQATVSGVSHKLAGWSPTPWDADLWNIADWRSTP